MRHELRRAQAAAMDPAADALTRIRQGSVASVRFMAEHRSYFGLLDVERRDERLSELLREGSDVYAADVIRLVVEAQDAGLVDDGDPRWYAVGVMGAVSSFSNALRNGAVEADVDELATAVGAVGGRRPDDAPVAGATTGDRQLLTSRLLTPRSLQRP